MVKTTRLVPCGQATHSETSENARSLSLHGGRSLPDEAIFSTVAEDCFAPTALAKTKWAVRPAVKTTRWSFQEAPH